MSAGDGCVFCQKLQQLHTLPPEEVVWQFPAAVAFLGQWQYYQGYCVLIARRHATELFQLPTAERRQYLDELSMLAEAIAACFKPHKLNYELLGNQVPHLHWHVFPRYVDDPHKFQPVWADLDRAEREPAEKARLQQGQRSRAEIAALLRTQLQQMHTPTAAL